MLAAIAYHSDASIMVSTRNVRVGSLGSSEPPARCIGLIIDLPEHLFADTGHVDRAKIMFGVGITCREITEIRDRHPYFDLSRAAAPRSPRCRTYDRQDADKKFRAEKVVLLRDLSGFLFTH